MKLGIGGLVIRVEAGVTGAFGVDREKENSEIIGDTRNILKNNGKRKSKIDLILVKGDRLIDVCDVTQVGLWVGE